MNIPIAERKNVLLIIIRHFIKAVPIMHLVIISFSDIIMIYRFGLLADINARLHRSDLSRRLVSQLRGLSLTVC
jgi:hypothetical protein